ncbi:MAG: hypothetical protein HY054_14945 [Proteobacteria bacterium]|nr:hypothetical protein [Pseudomonadota bacterium]
MKLKLALAAALMAASSGVAPVLAANAAEPAPSRDCFPSRAITGYGISGEHTAYLTVGVRHYFLHINESTRDLDYDHNVSVRSLSSFICTGNGLGVQLMGGYPPIPHQVVGIERAPPGQPPHWAPGYHGEHD